ncbi:MAG: phosphoribosyltransferase [Bacillota bacterium]
MKFKDRADAGSKLAEVLKKLNPSDAVILSIPRGGVVVGAEVSDALGVPLDIIVPRKIGAPINPEMAVGAVAQDGSTFIDDRMISLLGISEDVLEDIIDSEVREISRRMTDYRGSDRYPDFKNNTLVIVDDGAATGYTMLAAARFTRRTLRPAGIIIAVPVAPPDTLELFRQEADEVVCLSSPDEFYAVGQFYSDFSQTTDREVLSILEKYKPKNMTGQPPPGKNSSPASE